VRPLFIANIYAELQLEFFSLIIIIITDLFLEGINPSTYRLDIALLGDRTRIGAFNVI